MAQYTKEQLAADLDRSIKEFMGAIPNPAKAIEEQSARLRAFQEQVTKQVGETKNILDRSKDFLKNPKQEGIRIVKDGLSAADNFFSKLFKTLSTDVGKLLKDLLKDVVSKISRNVDGFLKKTVQEIAKRLTSIGTNFLKSESKIKQEIAKVLGKIVTGLNKSLSTWGKGIGLPKAIGNISTMAAAAGKNSQALTALKDMPKALGTLVTFVKLIGKAAPLISAFVDLYWKNDVTNRLKQLERKAQLDTSVADRQFQALVTRLNRIESAVKGGSELGAISRNSSQILSEVRSLKQSASQSLGNDQSIKSTLSSISSSLRSPQQKDYTPQFAAITSALGTINTKVSTTPSAIDYNRVAQAAAAALSGFKPIIDLPSDLARKSDLAGLATAAAVNAIPSKIEKPAPIDYNQVTQAAKLALSGFTPTVNLPSDLARKSDLINLATKTDVDAIPGKVEKPTPIDYNQVTQAAKLALSGFTPTVNLPSDLARKSDLAGLATKTDVKAIPNSIKQPDLTTVIASVTTVGATVSLINSLMARRSDLADLARRSDVEAIPGKVKSQMPTTTCTYVADKGVPVNVKVPVSVFGVARIEQTKTVSVHEKMVEPTKLMFDELLKLNNGVDKVQKTTMIMRVLNTLGTIASIHNMIMLSRNLAQTAGDATSMVINAIGRISGLIDKDQELIDVNQIMGQTTNTFFEQMLGKETWTTTKKTWIKYSSIYSSAAMMLGTVRGMIDSTRSIAEWTANNTGRIGNALKRFGAVGENAYPWMSENVSSKNKFDMALDKYRGGVENMDDAFSSIESVAGESLSIKEESEELKEQWTKFNEHVKSNPNKTEADNKPNKDAADKAKTDSAGKDVVATDLNKSE